MSPHTLARAGQVLTRFEMRLHGNELRSSLRSAHIPVTAEEYLGTVRIRLAITAVLFLAAGSFFLSGGYHSEIAGIATSDPVLWIILFALVLPGQYVARMYYPQVVARGRRSRIDLDLPYAVSYMQALSTTMPPYQMIRRVCEEHDMFGEISKEFGMIVRDVELFGDDLDTAMKNLQRTTPSTRLRDLLNDLSIVFNSGGSVTAYLGAKTEYYREQARQELELVLKTIEIMAEVYVTAFVAGPIALIIMIVAQGMTSSTAMTWILPVMYVCIPAGALGMIWILSMMLPPENLEISRKATVEEEFGSAIPGSAETAFPQDTREHQDFLKTIEAGRRRNHLLHLLRHPFAAYIRSYYYGAGIGFFIAAMIGAIWYTGGFDTLIPHDRLETVLCLAVIGFMGPVALSYEGRRWYVHNIESHLPDFLRELSDMKDIGITLHEAIQRISRAKLGVLSSELSVASRDIDTGAYVSSALVKMEERIGLVSVKRAISLLVRASEVTENLRQIFVIAITDFEYYLRLKRERANTTIAYVMIIYLSFGIYLYTAYQLNVPFLASFQGMNLGIDTAGNLTEMFRIGLILALFSGIMAGQFSSNSVLAGFKHSMVLLIAAVVVFVYII